MSFDQPHDPILIHHALPKILCNPACNQLANLFLPLRVRDISNNIKRMRAEILKGTELSEPHLAANVETGRSRWLGSRIVEVPASWINRTAQMGRSSFGLVHLAPNYVFTLLRIVQERYRSRRPFTRALRRSRHVPGTERSHD
jgi:hypothetical protein